MNSDNFCNAKYISSLSLSLNGMSKLGCTPTLQGKMELFPGFLAKAATNLSACKNGVKKCLFLYFRSNQVKP